MVILLYNLFQIAGLFLFFPLLIIIALVIPKYRGRVPPRLGIGTEKILGNLPDRQQKIWIHALSVGEVLSAQPLVKGLRKTYPEATLIFSATTKTGEELAQQTMKNEVDLFVPFPFDIRFIVKKIISQINPDLFILIETDFWPNFLHTLDEQNIPAILVNGRISKVSYRNYKKFRMIFLPMFNTFRFISMQTAYDAHKMIRFGVKPDLVKALGNLKYDAVLPETVGWDLEHRPTAFYRQQFGIPLEKTVWIAGSTHPGEEKIILSAYKRLSLLFPDIFLIIAPRKVERGREIKEMAAGMGLTVRRRTAPFQDEEIPGAPLLILDTMGELTRMYSFCDIAFVGGSLVPDGGHNPLEPAAFGKPVLFGPYMDDFVEISTDLLDKKAAISCHDEDELFENLNALLINANLRDRMGEKAQSLVLQHRGVTKRHLEIIDIILNAKSLAGQPVPGLD
ncbi:MAG: 3-deoxy-D-manno-octulosonic acid transferase [Proteobacteria bacterium]|nr:3-deoxy-D-manno-octulosonic acid transferase [Pseudomonadota bacterium]